ncbi:gliding motility-associated C-terminal domain-containing protein, partial [Microcystis aeruginosa]|uniref:gliding motility-associated C-terminal domain-containing protein n=1 Tax=Microcystis aeruginosa TaxID=1126 RepID=UPI000B148C14
TTYTFTPDASVVSCGIPTTVQITITAPTAVVLPSIQSSYCLGDTPAVLPTVIDGIQGSWNPPAIDTSVATINASYQFTPDAGECASAPSPLLITVTAPLTPVFGSLVTQYCIGSTVSLPNTSDNGITGQWSGNINTAAAGDYDVEFIPSVACANQVPATITIIAPPVLSPVSNVVSCESSYTLPSITVGGYFSSPGGQNPITNNELTTSQTVYIYAPSSLAGCFSEVSFTVTLAPLTLPGVPDVSSCTQYILPTLDPGEQYNSSPTGGQDTVIAAGTAITSDTTMYIFATNAQGCSDSVSFSIDIKGCEIQKGISPNGDGSNDSLDLSEFDVRELKIYNRYGMEVYSRANYVDEWFGQSKSGDELPDGTYFYVVEFNNEPTRTGWIYINKERN